MDLVDEKHVALLEVGEQRGQVAGLLNHRAGSSADAYTQFGGDDVGKRGLAEPRGSEKKNVVQRVSPLQSRLDGNTDILLDPLLADVVVDPFWAERQLVAQLFRTSESGNDPAFHLDVPPEF